MSLNEFRKDVTDEVATILAPGFNIDVTTTQTVPHSSDGAITFPNLDDRSQRTKLIESAVLYVDMRRSTELSLQHRSHTVAKLYSAFVRAMARCATQSHGEVRGIIGDRVMILFDTANCFTHAIDAAILINSICKHVLNELFPHNEISFGVGIEYGRMLATKTGIRRHGAAQQSYRSLVWLGRPANIASKLTDAANKAEKAIDLIMLDVVYMRGGQLIHRQEFPHTFSEAFTFNPATGMMHHADPTFHSFTTFKQKWVEKEAMPPILMSKRVYDGFRRAQPNAPSIVNGWFKPVQIEIPGYTEQAYGGDVIFLAFK
jgi:adenylate cyclase